MACGFTTESRNDVTSAESLGGAGSGLNPLMISSGVLVSARAGGNLLDRVLGLRIHPSVGFGMSIGETEVAAPIVE